MSECNSEFQFFNQLQYRMCSNVRYLYEYLDNFNILHYSTSMTGLLMAITPVTVAVIAPFAGSLSDRIGSRQITTLGLVLLLIGYISREVFEREVAKLL